MNRLAARNLFNLAAIMFVFTTGIVAQPVFWTVEYVDGGSIPAGIVDDSLRTHLCYTTTIGSMNYAYRDQAGWHCSILDGSIMGGIWGKSLAAEPAGTLHVAYLGMDVYPWLGYARKGIDGWEIEHLETAAQFMGAPSLALDPLNNPHLAYTKMWATNILIHAHKSAGWEFETVAGEFENAPSIAVDEGGDVHIAYSDQGGGENLIYAVKGSTGWGFELVDADGMYLPTVLAPSLALDGGGNPHISYFTDSDPALKYAFRTERGWTIESVDVSGGAGTYSSLKVDGSGGPHIAYYDYADGDLKYAFRSPSGWQILRVDTDGDVGRHACLFLDRFDNPHILYDDVDTGFVKYARPGLDLEVMDLPDGTIRLQWSELNGASEYWVYGVWDLEYFDPELTPPYTYRIEVTGSTWSGIFPPPPFDGAFLVVGMTAEEYEIGRSCLEGYYAFPWTILR